MTSKKQPRNVRFYTRDGCSLCDKIEPELQHLADAGTITLETIDIAGDAALEEAYGTRIPVVDVEDGPFLEGRISKYRIQRALALSEDS